MSLESYKNLPKQHILIRPSNLYKNYTITDLDISNYKSLKEFISESASTSLYTGSLNTYYTSVYSGSIPKFPSMNIKYARNYINEVTGLDRTYPAIKDNEYVLSYNYKLKNGDHFYPLYESQSGYINSDGTYYKMVWYSLNKLFYGDKATYFDLMSESSSSLDNEAFIFEIPQYYVGDSIERGKFELIDAHNVKQLPYSQTGSSDNTIALNPSASLGIKLVDDKRGNLFDLNYSSSIQRGNVFYEMGLVVITDIEYAIYFYNNLINIALPGITYTSTDPYMILNNKIQFDNISIL